MLFLRHEIPVIALEIVCDNRDRLRDFFHQRIRSLEKIANAMFSFEAKRTGFCGIGTSHLQTRGTMICVVLTRVLSLVVVGLEAVRTDITGPEIRRERCNDIVIFILV